MSEKMHFKVKNGLKNILGREMITNEIVAIFELVKNSFDAKAKKVIIEFNQVKRNISIIDDGTGMSKDDIQQKWLSLAYSYKKGEKKSNKEFYAGAKGIGRFACDRLGSKVTVITKVLGSQVDSVIEVDWNDFEYVPSGRFEEVELIYNERETTFPTKHGTIIQISNVRDEWNEKKFDALKESLSKLINPFERKNISKIYLKVIEDDLLQTTTEVQIENNLLDILQNRTTKITCVFDNKITVDMVDRGQKIYKIVREENDTILSNIKMELFYLNRSAKIYFSKKMKDKSGGAQKDYGSIFVYKNNFRVFPYGELNFDPFGLDTRKTQGTKRFLGNRELLGCITIEDDKDHFVEVSSRDGGFIKNIYAIELMRCYMEFVHRPLERFVGMIKWGSDPSGNDIYLKDNKDYTDEKLILPSFLNKKTDTFEVFAKVEIPKNIVTQLEQIEEGLVESTEAQNKILKDTKRVINEQRESIAKLEQKNESNQKTIIALENQTNFLRNLTSEENILQSEIAHHTSKMANSLVSSCEDLVSYFNSNNLMTNELLGYLSDIQFIADKLKVFKDVVLKGNFSAKNPVNMNLYEYLSFYLNNSGTVKSYKLNLHIVNRNVDVEGLIYKFQPYDISVMVDNFASNVYELGGSILQFEFIQEKSGVFLEVFSNTPLIQEDKLEKIFDLGFSTKESGTGIGLYQIKSVVETYFENIVVVNEERGVKFRILLK